MLDPRRVQKHIVNVCNSFRLPGQWSMFGLDSRMVTVLIMIASSLIWATNDVMSKQNDVLRRMQAALCGGSHLWRQMIDASAPRILLVLACAAGSG